MAHHNTVRRYPPVDYYDVVAVDGADGPQPPRRPLCGLSALRRVGRTGPLFRPLRPVVAWGLERVFDFSRSFPYNEAARRRTVWTG